MIANLKTKLRKKQYLDTMQMKHYIKNLILLMKWKKLLQNL